MSSTNAIGIVTGIDVGVTVIIIADTVTTIGVGTSTVLRLPSRNKAALETPMSERDRTR